MPLADKKKVQTMVNVSGDALVEIRKQVAILKVVRTKFQTHSPVTTGTVLQGITGTLNTLVNTLDTASADPAWDTVINGKVETHRNKALE